MDEEKIRQAWNDYFKITTAWAMHKKRRRVELVSKIILLSTGVFIIVHFFFTFPAQLANIKWYLSKIKFSSKKETIYLPEIKSATSLSEVKSVAFDVTGLTVPRPPSVSGPPQYPRLGLADLDNNYLIISKINVKAPIIWNSELDEKTMFNNLRNGVVHYKGTALPSDKKGNIFIAGHSSYYFWDSGRYKTVFALLGRLEKGDQIALAYQNKVYIYEVFDKIVVFPNQTEVLEQSNGPILSLMT